jgi:hypothetical protein
MELHLKLANLFFWMPLGCGGLVVTELLNHCIFRDFV